MIEAEQTRLCCWLFGIGEAEGLAVQSSKEAQIKIESETVKRPSGSLFNGVLPDFVRKRTLCLASRLTKGMKKCEAVLTFTEVHSLHCC